MCTGETKRPDRYTPSRCAIRIWTSLITSVVTPVLTYYLTKTWNTWNTANKPSTCNYYGSKPWNGGAGDCSNSLASGSTCQPTCLPGYTVSGPSSCNDGTLTAARCDANCDARRVPSNGRNSGTCTGSLASGSTCEPSCLPGYTVSGPTSCNNGTLTAARCEAIFIVPVVVGILVWFLGMLLYKTLCQP